jgi:hypothetical protein
MNSRVGDGWTFRNNKLARRWFSIGAFPTTAIFIRALNVHDSPRHAAGTQLLAKRVLRTVAISLNSEKY